MTARTTFVFASPGAAFLIVPKMTAFLRSLDSLARVLSQRTSCVRINIMNRFLRSKKVGLLCGKCLLMPAPEIGIPAFEA